MDSQPPPVTPRRNPVRRCRQPPPQPPSQPPSDHHQTTTQNPNPNPNSSQFNIDLLKTIINSGTLKSNESDDNIASISKLKFIPLLDGTYTSLSEGVVWLGVDKAAFRGFEKLYSKLRVVNPDLINSSDIVKLGVRRFSLDAVLELVILPVLCDGTNDREVMIECFLFVMFCLDECENEREEIFSRLCKDGCVWTSDGCKRLGEVDVHFGKGYGNLVDIGKLVSGSDMKWYEVDVGYMDHPVVKASPDGEMKLRKFLERLGVTDFVKIVKKVYERRENVRKCKTSDYDSQELKRLLSYVSLSGGGEKGRELLEVIDSLWVEYFSGKSTSFGYVDGKFMPFKSSIKTIFQGVPWLASSMDDQLHFPKDLYYDCQNVHKVFGDRAPYAIPKVNNVKLANYIGLKSTVTLDDALSVLELWRKSENFKASISDMSKFYTYIWKEMSISKQKIVGNLHSQAFIFVPYSFGSKLEEVSGLFLSPNEVYWHDSMGLMKQTKSTVAHSPFSKMLCNIYPDLHDFFVDEFGVDDNPPLSCYLQFLRQLSSGSSPSLEAKTVFQVFQKWSDGLDSGVLRSDDIDYLKKTMEEKETTILPTVQDKWVSLHQSFGLVCWCDDEELKKDFQNLNNVNFLCLGNLTTEGKQNLQDKVLVLFRRLGISSLSEVVTREAMYDGLSDSSCKTSLVSWALPYAQRFIYRNHPNEYSQLKLSGFKKLNYLKILVAEKLFYRNVVKRFGIKSSKRYERSCLLQDNILYATLKSNPLSLFTELSRFLAAGIPESPLANFLDLITTMKESGFTEKQLESHVTNVQNLPLLPNEESQWSISSMPSPVDDKITLTASLGLSLDVNTPKSTPKKYRNVSKTKPVDTDKRRSSMPSPVHDKITPTAALGLSLDDVNTPKSTPKKYRNVSKTKPVDTDKRRLSMPSPVDDKITLTASLGLSLDDVNTPQSTPKKYGNASKTKPVDTMIQDVTKDSIESNGERIIEQSPSSATPSVMLEEDEALKDQPGTGIDTQFSEMKIGFKGQSDHGTGIVSSDVNAGFSSINTEIDRLSLGTVTTQQANGVKGSGQSYSISEEEAAKIIENIRREEFGLDPAFSAIEENFLKKQNARLGRALQHLSVELYSQDSHFLLELIQNADDNMYPCDVEPTLTFILQETGVIVLNNEQGFSVENIKALCDVGDSTKKEASAGYIGKKGIGFKSVFRVTDAPEIHSNGFHFKFDTSEGEIGYVLPTNVPPCDINIFSKMVSVHSDPTDEKDWNTCIMLPFKLKKNEDFSVEKLNSMFSNLHPSLLLFLHNLRCIRFRNLLDDSLIVMRKEAVGNGIVHVSTGKDKLTWFVESRKLKSSHIREDVETTEISVALTLEYDSSNGNFIPKLDQQQVFAFLPLRGYGLKFIIQADFVLSSSREEVNNDSPWNKFLLSELPNLFVSAEQSFCSLPCFKENPAKGVSVFMSFVPLGGEVDGFFSQLPRKIISKLRNSKCLLLEGDNNEWVPPSNVLRNWTEATRSLLPESLIKELLGVGVGYLNKDTVLTDSLAQALKIEECGPKFLIRIMSSLCAGSLKSMGLSWISSWLNVLFLMSGNGIQAEVISSLYKLRFIPLVDGTYTSLQDGQIWLHTDPDPDHRFEAFGKLYTKLRVVNPALLSDSNAENVTQMLYKVGVQRLSEHEVLKMHVLPAISNEIYLKENTGLITELLSFIMFHFETSCHECLVEKEYILSQLRYYAFISTNHGYKRLADVPIHFSKEFGNLIDISKLVSGTDMNWVEIDKSYLEHAVYKSSPAATSKLKKFLQELGLTDFVKITREEKCISPGIIVTDYNSQELWHLLSHVSSKCDREKCEYLLEVLDTLWDDYSSDKLTAFCSTNGQYKTFISSVIQILHGVRWLVSSMDDQLHFPYELFHNCETVHAVLGDNAPYCIPKVNNVKLLNDIGLKNTVHLDDALSVLEAWRKSEKPFKASISQMSKFYTYIWNEMSTSKQKIVENLHSQAFIFVPCSFGSTNEVVSGLFFSPTEVYWHDSIVSSMEQAKSTHPQFGQPATQRPFSKMLFNFYPGLQYFFVNEFGVAENPPLRSYLQLLLQLSTESSPSQASKTVFLVFQKWSDGLDSGVLSSDEVDYMKKIMEEKGMKILPTVKNKWVSLHQSFGLICWCDDEELRKEFMNLNGIDFLSFGELTDLEKQMLQTKVSVLCQRLGIPSISEVVTREAIADGLRDGSFKTSLVNWALPFTQRYIYSNHPNEYSLLKVSEFNNINSLKIVVVEKLFYKNVIKRYGIKSDNRCECNCLVQDNVLYATHESDSYSLFKKLSHILLAGIPESYLANFLQLITTMTETGKTEDQMELFIANSQNIQKLPCVESQWSLVSMASPEQDSEWPPAHWKTAPKFEYASETKVVNADQTRHVVTEESIESNLDLNNEEDLASMMGSLKFEYASKTKAVNDDQTRHDITEEPIESNGDLNNEEELASMMGSLKLEDAAAKREVQESGIYTDASDGYIGFEGQFVFGQNTASYNGDFSAFSRRNRSNLFRRHQQSWHTVTPQKVIYGGMGDFMAFDAGQQYDSGAESTSEQTIQENPAQTIQENPASTTTSVILEQDEALKDQSESGISTVSSDTELGFKDQSGYKKPDSFGRDTAKTKRDATERLIEIDGDWIVKEKPASTVPSVILEENETSKDQLDSGVDASPVTPQHVVTGRTGEEEAFKFFCAKQDQLDSGVEASPVTPQHVITGRTGEEEAFKFFCAKPGEKTVTWVNEFSESGLPYDIVIEDKDNNKEYIEVKSTSKANKDWFNISMNEWKFAVGIGDSFSIACVVLLDGKPPKITVHENLLGKCQQGELQLGFRLDGKLPKITVYSSRKSTALCIYVVT